MYSKNRSGSIKSHSGENSEENWISPIRTLWEVRTRKVSYIEHIRQTGSKRQRKTGLGLYF
ncbi:hypothetical protein A0128_19095 [Leptospira tipperaryensis]|uniref:Uncharacterized protein n=1 Tax=Leptospira tipperaryensis TaxID=2564040 RepID=A0A1D7V1Q5_9LEPT|nr:hypothetical protein A0128_19095 [Leptospira tipperaryensis]